MRLIISLLFTFFIYAEEPSLVIVVPSYNNLKWYELNIDSILCQTYKNVRTIYINDASTDGTAEVVEKYLIEKGVDFCKIIFDPKGTDPIQTTEHFCKEINQENHAFTLVCNTRRSGAMTNIYHAVHSCKDDEIVLLLDGDDWFYDEEVLNQIQQVYASKNIWFTHGSLIEYPWGNITWCEPIPKSVILNHSIRKHSKCPTHLRTFYSWIFKKIHLEDFLFNGQFMPMAWDLAIMLPIVEMAGERHIFIEDVTYVYNLENPINDNKVNPQLQRDLDQYIRNKTPYQRLDDRL